MTDGGNAPRFDVAVVGLGLVGAAALRHLTAAGFSCAGIGPPEPMDWRSHQGVFASHYDSGRITRKLDKRREWAVLATRSIAQYAAIEAASSVQFHHPVGVVMADVDPQRLASISSVADALGTSYRVIPSDAPFEDERIAVPSGATVLHEPAPPLGVLRLHDPDETAAVIRPVGEAGEAGGHPGFEADGFRMEVRDVGHGALGALAVRGEGPETDLSLVS